MMKYAAGIVLYNPEIERLKLNIDAINTQIDLVYCFDNASNNIDDIKNLINEYKNLILIESSRNVGISIALNVIAQKAIENNVKWLLTLDQDSICPENMINEFTKFIDYEKIAMICPNVIDKRMARSLSYKENIEYVDFCITSGSFVKLDVLRKLKGFDEYLFVGCIDDEYSYRILLNNYKILKINYCILEQEFGILLPKKTAKIWNFISNILHIDKLKSLSYKRIIVPTRFYYLSRNYLYLKKKYKLYPKKEFGYKKIAFESISAFLRGDQKFEILKAVISGLKDGYKVKVEPYKLESR